MIEPLEGNILQRKFTPRPGATVWCFASLKAARALTWIQAGTVKNTMPIYSLYCVPAEKTGFMNWIIFELAKPIVGADPFLLVTHFAMWGDDLTPCDNS